MQASFLFAQRFGGTPPSVKWREIDTDTVRVIFPAALDSQANRIASLVHFEAARRTLALGNKLRKIDIVLQNETTVSNGYVGLGPYRSEFYLTPPTDNFSQGAMPWGDQLALHEYRHVQQFNNFRNGLSQVMGVLFGQEGYALAVNAAVPDWFFEGDAVYNETVLSSQGRGRLPLFLNAFPSLWLADKKYSWMKLRNGSLKDYVPNHYNLGYLLVNYGYLKYGSDFWQKVTHDASAYKSLIYPFQKALEKHAGKSFPAFREEALKFYEATAREEAASNDGDEAGPAPVMSLNKRVVTNYLFPYSVSGDSTVYIKTAYDKRPAFMLRDSRGEHRLRFRDISGDRQFSYRNGRVVYTAYETDPRWRWRDYSVIKYFDIATQRQHQVTSKSKYFTPDISNSGEKIAAVQLAPDGKSEVHILNTQNGEVVQRLSSPGVLSFTDPKFIGEDSLVIAIRTTDGQMALAISDLKNATMTKITSPSFNVLGYPCVTGNRIYFTASFGGRDNIFVMNLHGGPLEELQQTGRWEIIMSMSRMATSAGHH